MCIYINMQTYRKTESPEEELLWIQQKARAQELGMRLHRAQIQNRLVDYEGWIADLEYMVANCRDLQLQQLYLRFHTSAVAEWRSHPDYRETPPPAQIKIPKHQPF